MIRPLRVGREVCKGVCDLMKPSVQVGKRATEGATARLQRAASRDRKPLAFRKIQTDSRLVKGNGGEAERR